MLKQNHNEKSKKQFHCPLGYGIMWWKGLQYSECPLFAGFRNMPECRECHLKIDKNFTPKPYEDTRKDKKPKKKKDKRGKKR